MINGQIANNDTILCANSGALLSASLSGLNGDRIYQRAGESGGAIVNGVSFNVKALQDFYLDTLYVPVTGNSTSLDVYFRSGYVNVPLDLYDGSWVPLALGFPVSPAGNVVAPSDLVSAPMPSDFLISAGTPC